MVKSFKANPMYYPRKIEKEVLRGIEHNPVTAILGPRQCGKSTLAKYIIGSISKEVVFIDLERPADIQKLENAEWFLVANKEKLICIDEIQRRPDLFPLLRSLVDDWGGTGHFLILGSASSDLLKQSSESLAGRITYKYLTPFLIDELPEGYSSDKYLLRGGFPRSLLAEDENISFEWREDFITTFLERDLLLWSGFSPATMKKLWMMMANLNGQIVNYSLIAASLGVSSVTAKNYADLLSSTFMLRLLPPYLAKTRKRLIKSPKIYIADTGLTNALLGISEFNQLAGHPSMGAAWEALVFANLFGSFPKGGFYFYRTSNGAEIDIILTYRGKLIAVECKASTSPVLTSGTYSAIDDIKPDATIVVSPVENGWPLKPGIEVLNISSAIEKVKQLLIKPKM